MRTRELNGFTYPYYGSSSQREFDYLRAWHELAYPSYNELEDEVRKLAEATCVVAKDQQQDSTLDVTWSSDEHQLAFQVMADEQPTALAKAARTVYFLGHWWCRPIIEPYFEPCGPTLGDYELIIPKEPLFCLVGRLYSDGGSWKFSNYADQALRERLKLPPRSTFSSNNKAFFQVLEGMLRLCLSYKSKKDGEGWTWREIGLATPEKLEQVRATIEGLITITPTEEPEHLITTPDAFDSIVKRLKRDRDDFEQAWLDTDKYLY